MFIGSFSPASYEGFQTDVDSAIKAFQAAGVKKLLIDLSNNGGG
jgi:C-terminal processing protease CtpA/Prc